LKKSDGERERIQHIIYRLRATISSLEKTVKDQNYPPGREDTQSLLVTAYELIVAITRLETFHENEKLSEKPVEELPEYKELSQKLKTTQEWYSVRWQRLRDELKDTEYWTVINSIMANGVGDIHEPPSYYQQINLLKHELEKTKEERDQAQKNYYWMVENAASNKLDGYRELGAKCAALETERDEAYTKAKAAIAYMQEKINTLEKQNSLPKRSKKAK